jgi:hypothetical protein
MVDKPKRIQRKRTKGWRMPEGAIYVGLGSNWGNPYTIGDYLDKGPYAGTTVTDNEHAVRLYREWAIEAIKGRALPRADGHTPTLYEVHSSLMKLRGKDLACWCPLDKPCHADVLLELANEDAQS